jgi:hypothetical protein
MIWLVAYSEFSANPFREKFLTAPRGFWELPRNCVSNFVRYGGGQTQEGGARGRNSCVCPPCRNGILAMEMPKPKRKVGRFQSEKLNFYGINSQHKKIKFS